MSSIKSATLCLMLAALCVGCGGKHGAKVSGKVLLDGEPLPSESVGRVTFVPVGGGSPAYGRIDEESYYSLRTGRDASLPPGEYAVTVAVNERAAEERAPDGGPPPIGPSITPAKYRRAQTSGLQFTVERGSNSIDLELNSGA